MALSVSNKENILPTDSDLNLDRSSVLNEKGYEDFANVLQKLAQKNFLKNVPWSDIKKNYKKKTGRILNTDELNSILGVHGLSRNEIIRTKLSSVLKFADEKNHIVTIVKMGINKKRKWSPDNENTEIEISENRSSSVSSNYSSTCPDSSDPSRSSSPIFDEKKLKNNEGEENLVIDEGNTTFKIEYEANFSSNTIATHATILETPFALKDISKISQDCSILNMPTYYSYNEAEILLGKCETQENFMEKSENSYPEIENLQILDENFFTEVSSTSASFFDCLDPSFGEWKSGLTDDFSNLCVRSPGEEIGEPPSLVDRFSMASSQDLYETAPTSPDRLDLMSNSAYSAYQSAVEDFDSEIEVETEEELTPPASPLSRTFLARENTQTNHFEDDSTKDNDQKNSSSIDGASMIVQSDESNLLKNLSPEKNSATLPHRFLHDHDYIETNTHHELHENNELDIETKTVVEIEILSNKEQNDLKSSLGITLESEKAEMERQHVTIETKICIKNEIKTNEELETPIEDLIQLNHQINQIISNRKDMFENQEIDKNSIDIQNEPRNENNILESSMDVSRLPVLYADDEPASFIRPTISRPEFSDDEDGFADVHTNGPNNIQAPIKSIRAMRRSAKCCLVM